MQHMTVQKKLNEIFWWLGFEVLMLDQAYSPVTFGNPKELWDVGCLVVARKSIGKDTKL